MKKFRAFVLLILIVAAAAAAVAVPGLKRKSLQSRTVAAEEAGKVIYLTFDDGPGAYTEQLLDVLKKYGVKATFFVTDGYPEYESLIAREAKDGHSVGVHSYTHKYNSIYASAEAYIDDFNKMNDVIRAQTGSRTKLFRFPGGSSNTVSNFNPGIMSTLTKLMKDKGYFYYDWNVLSGDAGETTDTNQIYRNVINGCSQNKVSVVLMHDIKSYSVAAVEDIIKWGLENGYSFMALNEYSYGSHHGVNN